MDSAGVRLGGGGACNLLVRIAVNDVRRIARLVMAWSIDAGCRYQPRRQQTQPGLRHEHWLFASEFQGGDATTVDRNVIPEHERSVLSQSSCLDAHASRFLVQSGGRHGIRHHLNSGCSISLNSQTQFSFSRPDGHLNPTTLNVELWDQTHFSANVAPTRQDQSSTRCCVGMK